MKLFSAFFSATIMLFAIYSCNNPNTNYENVPIIKTQKELNSLTRHDSICKILGHLKKCTTEIKGKADASRFFNFEVILQDGSIIFINKACRIRKEYIDMPVEIVAKIANSPVHERPCPPYCQNAMTTQIQEILVIDIHKP